MAIMEIRDFFLLVYRDFYLGNAAEVYDSACPRFFWGIFSGASQHGIFAGNSRVNFFQTRVAVVLNAI
ncbi:hypothetical protein [Sphingobacterium hotanense]|uniref:hypothetical protein n=1 Tax=Sphingobacterium hotanense TaxID=649196 RepID=UPI001CA89261|nr:hypothetical protein [Sphingobacterium hotanense]